MPSLTRRKLLQFASALPILPAFAGETPASLQTLSTFPYEDVELLDSPFQQQFNQNHAFFLQLSEDRLLKIYRQRVGLPAPGCGYGRLV